MFRAFILAITLAFASLMVAGCSDEQDYEMGEDSDLDANPQWSKNPNANEDAEEVENPQPAEEINRNKDDDDLMEPYPEDDASGLEEATEQGIGQQY